MKYLASIAAVLTAFPAAAHVADAPHVHGDQAGALMVGVALTALAGGVAVVRAHAMGRRK